LEGEAGTTECLALFEMVTRIVPGKQLRMVNGGLTSHVASTAVTGALIGYEMHNGVTESAAQVCPFAELERPPYGSVGADHKVAGTYIHGVFDEPAACHAILAWAGLKAQGEQSVDYQRHRLQQLDRLADQVEQCLDTERLRRLLQL